MVSATFFHGELKKNAKWQGGDVSSEAKVLQFTAQMSELVAQTSPTMLAAVDTTVLVVLNYRGFRQTSGSNSPAAGK